MVIEWLHGTGYQVEAKSNDVGFILDTWKRIFEGEHTGKLILASDGLFELKELENRQPSLAPVDPQLATEKLAQGEFSVVVKAQPTPGPRSSRYTVK